MKHILKYLRDYTKECIIAPLFKLLEATFELIVPLVMARLIDRGIGEEDVPCIWRMGGVLVLLMAVGLVCSVVAQYFAANAAVGFSAKLRHALFAHIEGLSYRELDEVGTSTLITRMTSDINQVQSGVNMVLRLFMRSPFIVIGAMVMAFAVDVKAALIFVVAIPLLAVVVFSVMVLSIPMFAKVQARLDEVMGHTRENLEGVRVIRAFGREAEESREFNASNDLLARMQMAVGRLSALMNPLTYIIVTLATLAIIWVGGRHVFLGVLTTGSVVALVNYMSQVLAELVKLADLIIIINKSIACGNRIGAVLEIQPSIVSPVIKENMFENNNHEDGIAASDFAVEFSHVCLTYAGAPEEALTDISFAARRGQTVGVIGGTGSGKSSVVNLIPRFYEATSGSVKVGGRDVRECPLDALRGRIGVVPQKAVLFEGTVAENLRWGKPDAAEDELWAALDVAQARDVVEGKEGGLGFAIEQGGKNLSGGQRQRLTIARALVRDPEILILDDSASALDFATDARLRAALRAMQGERTIFIVSQRLSSVQSADLILVMDDGRLAGAGTHEELLAGCEVYREIYDSQFKKEQGAKVS
ncbi:MAG: ABC transporter ATP-binding protein/permease [Clostridiales bacterium]|nr:ABC transporter ATP-binding protein/permease [Clostridiales bacterium]